MEDKAINLVLAAYALPRHGHGLFNLGKLGSLYMVFDPRRDITYHVDLKNGKVTKH